MLRGKVSRIKTGLIRALIIPITKAAIRAVVRSLISTPGRRYAAMIMARVPKSQLIRIFIFINNNPLKHCLQHCYLGQGRCCAKLLGELWN